MVEMTTTPFNLKGQIDAKIAEMITLSQTLTTAPKKFVDMSEDTAVLKTEEDKANRMYEEEIHKREALGGRSRKQTLQEFVILFFFVSFVLLVVSIALRAGTIEGRGASIKIMGLGAMALLIVSALILRYA